ncbi:phosphoglycolate phosphatase [Tamilnaduibacter salinus]|uniref:Phosphoglycolate phosphatase n=1 Tax=Tamilnaduibacter salinus TaxID=1484056 RepID=A0A2A2I7Y0_9GAMM|nr:HAD-IA family hydrolase [Tamilnaduibacter salinus]PAV27404.1 phosphoglycolate phosphatase [Tamilnaduibacter salinus]
MSRPSVALFDLDGTLIDTAPNFIRCLNMIRARYNLPSLPHQRIRRHVSDGAKAMIRVGFDLLPEDDDYFDRHAEFLDLYESEIAVETRLFPGMDKVLQWLEGQGVPWGIVTNKPRRFTVPLLAALDLAERCDAVVCPDDVDYRKPHPEPLLLGAHLAKANPEGGVYVGDHQRDIESGRRAGMTTIAARYGYIAEPADVPSWEADVTIDSARELLAWLEQG